nr:MAG TPA: Chlororespiratory reduction 6 [Caudoviricetes sp.]
MLAVPYLLFLLDLKNHLLNTIYNILLPHQ